MAMLLRSSRAGGLARLRALQSGFSSAPPNSEKSKVERHETFQKVKQTHKDTMKSHEGWDERMASASEAAVKADKEDGFHPEPAESVEQMQAHSVDVIKETGGNVSEPHEPAAEPRGS